MLGLSAFDLAEYLGNGISAWMKSDLHNVIKNKKVLYIRYNINQVEAEMTKGEIIQI